MIIHRTLCFKMQILNDDRLHFFFSFFRYKSPKICCFPPKENRHLLTIYDNLNHEECFYKKGECSIMSSNYTYIKNAKIYTEENVVKGTLIIKDGFIEDYIAGETDLPSTGKIIDAKGLNVIPGFIDGHIHGAAGADTMDATEEAIDMMAKELPKEGTTSFLPTTITQSTENINKALKNVANYASKDGYAEVLGVHLEGPFIEKSKKGAQPEEYIQKPNLEQFNKWQQLSGNNIKTITMAPEHDEDGSFIQQLKEAGINVSAGHTDVNYKDMEIAVKRGVRQLTHLCNAMNGIHHRDVGAVGAAFLFEEIRAELIADGIHVDRKMLQLIFNNIGSDRIILITDAMRAKGLEPGDYELGGQPVIVTEDRAQLPSGSLAGSILKMDEGARIMLSLEGATIKDIIKMASMNPAKQIGVFDRKGSIKKGKDADLLIVDDELNIRKTICQGIIAYEED